MKPFVTAAVSFIIGAILGAYVYGHLIQRRLSALTAAEYLAISQQLRADHFNSALGIAEGNLLQLLPINHNTASSGWSYIVPSSKGIANNTIRVFKAYPPARLSETAPFADSYPDMTASNASEMKKWYMKRLENERAAIEIIANAQSK